MDSFVSGPLRPVITCGTWGLMTSLPVSFGSRALLWKLAGLVEAIIAVPVAAVFHSFHRTLFQEANFKEMRPWFTCMWFQVMICCVQNKYLETNKIDWSINFSVSLFPLRNKNTLKIVTFPLTIQIFFFSILRKINLNWIIQLQFWEKKIWILTILFLYIAI